MLCPTCQSPNPDGNRFCGHCGTAFAAKPTHARRRAEDLPKELVDFDKSIPLIAEPGSDRRNNVPENIREQARELFERERSREAKAEQKQESQIAARLHDAETERVAQRERQAEALRIETERESERRREMEGEREKERQREMERRRELEAERVAVTVPAEDERRVQLPSGFLGLNTVEEPAEPAPAKTNSSGGSRLTSRTANNHFLNLDYDQQPKTTGVSGPSFLGLSDDLEDVEQDEAESHTRRNVALVVLLLLIGLGAVQWRQIRDQTLPFVKNGTQKVMLRVKGKGAQPAANDSTSPNANVTPNGGPNMEVAPTNDALKKAEAAANTSAATPATPNGTQGASTDAVKSETENASNSKSAADAANKAAATPSTTGGAVGAAIPDGSETAKSKDSDSEEPAKPTAKDDEKKSAAVDASPKKARKPSGADRPQIADDEPQAGSAELAQANSASSPEVQRQLLWSAVKKGNTDASVKLAELYIMGRGVEKSCDQAMVLLRSASAHNSARARGKLGAMYATGECVEQDRVQAYHWMSMALQSNPGSDWTARYRESIWDQMTAGEKMRAKRDR